MTAVGSKADRHAARAAVTAYHEACLSELVSHVAEAIDAHRVGQLTAYDVDEIIHQYHRAARQLWTFCWAAGGVEVAVGTIERQAAPGNCATDWWDVGAPRGRREGPDR